jgi:hypothetical protein
MGGTWRIRVGAMAFVCGVSAAVLLPAGGAAAAQKLPPETFTGSCNFQVETVPPGLGFIFQFAGTCSGIFDGQAVTGYPVLMTAQGHGAGSTGTPPLVTGRGALLFEVPCGGGGYCLTPVAFRLVEITPYAFAVLGTRGGFGVGTAPSGVDSPGSATFQAYGLTSPGVQVGPG